MRFKKLMIGMLAGVLLLGLVGGACAEDDIKQKKALKKNGAIEKQKTPSKAQLISFVEKQLKDGYDFLNSASNDKYSISIDNDCTVHSEAIYNKGTSRSHTSTSKFKLNDIGEFRLGHTGYKNERTYWLKVTCKDCINVVNRGDAFTRGDIELFLIDNYEIAKQSLKSLQMLTKICGGNTASVSDRTKEDDDDYRNSINSSSESSDGYTKSGDGTWVSSERLQTPITCDNGKYKSINYYSGSGISNRYGIQGYSGYYSSFEDAARSACK